MDPDTPLIPVEKVAAKLGLDITSLTADQRETITDAIHDAEAVVEGHLGRSLRPHRATLGPRWPAPGTDLLDWRAWPGLVAEVDDHVAVVAADPDPATPGAYTLTLAVGLDGARERPIARYVRAHAVESVRNDPQNPYGKRRVSSLSAEGQSLNFERESTADGAAGNLPRLDSLRRYRRFSVHKPNQQPHPPWPMSSAPVGWDPR